MQIKLRYTDIEKFSQWLYVFYQPNHILFFSSFLNDIINKNATKIDKARRKAIKRDFKKISILYQTLDNDERFFLECSDQLFIREINNLKKETFDFDSEKFTGFSVNHFEYSLLRQCVLATEQIFDFFKKNEDLTFVKELFHDGEDHIRVDVNINALKSDVFIRNFQQRIDDFYSGKI